MPEREQATAVDDRGEPDVDEYQGEWDGCVVASTGHPVRIEPKPYQPYPRSAP